MKLLSNYNILICLSLLLIGCSDELVNPQTTGGDDGTGQQEPVLFTTLVPDVTATRAASAKGEWQEKVQAYKAVQHNYDFTIEMWQEGAETSKGSAKYNAVKTTTPDDFDAIADNDGTLEVQKGQTPLYWQDNVTRWGFKAEANNNPLVANQGTQDDWLAMDYLKGHSYLPIWEGSDADGVGTDPDVIQYKTSKEWYTDNKKSMDLSGLMPESSDDYKKVPLYMTHQRAWITVILKAGEGVSRDKLKFATASTNIAMSINSFAPGMDEPLVINNAWARECLIDYDKDKNGPAATGVSTTRYDAIVEPHNYATRKDEEQIFKVNLSDQNFSFMASNDFRYLTGTDEDKADADNDYNLQAGKHLTITATLSRASRKILITAWIEDWTEVATQTICDDYGQNGDPFIIKNRTDLIEFLTNEKKNRQGSVGIIQPTELELDVVKEDGTKEPWSSEYDLNATLNLAGCTLKTSHRLFNNLSSSANLVNGNVQVQDDAEVDCAIAKNNDGTIERVNITTTSEISTAKASVAGMVYKNSGTIFQCNSSLPVYGASPITIVGDNDAESYIGFVGGVAAVSVAHGTQSMAVIDGCVVNASVNGGSEVKGGGIVGYATGRVSNNTFEYGITISEDANRFKNIFYGVGSTGFRAYNNGWPTTSLNPIDAQETTPGYEGEKTNVNVYAGNRYDAVLDSQHELDLLMTTYNTQGKWYRVSNSFAVSRTAAEETDWKHGVVSDDNISSNNNNVRFNLEGNGKTIMLTGDKEVKTTSGMNPDEGEPTTYTTAPMLFNYVLGTIQNLTLSLEQPLVASPSTGGTGGTYDAEDAIAPLAYAVYNTGRLDNIKVKAVSNNFVQAATPAGLVVWAYGGAEITNCAVNVPVKMWTPSEMGKDARHYGGGLVACAANATISLSSYCVNTSTAIGCAEGSSANQSNYYYGGIVGGTAMKGNEAPALTILDCSSWFIATAPDATDPDKSSKGSIIAYAVYADKTAAANIHNGMATNTGGFTLSEGNWWPASANGVHTWFTGLNEEKTIGPRNAVDPTNPTQIPSW